MRCSCPLCRVGPDHTVLFLALCGVVGVSVVGWVCIQVGKPILTTVGAVVAVVVCTGVVRAFAGAVKAGGGDHGLQATRASRVVSASSPPLIAGEVEIPAATGQRATGPSWTSGSAESPSPVDELAARRAQKERAA